MYCRKGINARQVLDIMKQYFYEHLNEDQALLEEIKSERNA